MSQHSIIIDENYDVWVFGENYLGQLGLGDNNDRHTPTKIETLPPIVYASQSCNYILFLDFEGYVWFSGKFCKFDVVNVPTKIDQVQNIAKIASGSNHCLLLDHEGNVFSMGSNKYGQLGIKSSNHRLRPRKIKNIPKIKDICCGHKYSILLDIEGNVFVFGYNSFGQLGLGDKINRFTPTKILGNLPPIRSFSAGYYHSIFLDKNNNVYCCGSNAYDELGVGDFPWVLVPTRLFLPIGIKSIWCQSISTFLCDIDNNLWVFGANCNGQLGLGHYDGVKSPTRLIFNEEIYGIVGGHNSMIITNTKGECFSFGYNAFGQLGLGHTENVCVPTKIQSLEVPALTLRGRRFSVTKNARN